MNTTLPPDYATLVVDGADRLKFLQGQMTQDAARLGEGAVLRGAFLNPQGRVLALPYLIARGETVVLVLPPSVAGPLRDHLQRYILRSKVRLALPGEALAARFTANPPATAPAPAASAHTLGTGTLWLGPAAALTAAVADAELAAVRAGEPEVYAATAGSFVPQMLNLDLLEAISFTKGCYTGQEIVARTQHLGRIKRRMFRYVTSGAVAIPPPGSALTDAAGHGAEVVRSAATADGAELLAVTPLEARGSVLTGTDGSQWTPAEIGYPVP